MAAESLLLDAAAVRSIVKEVGRDACMDALISRLTAAITTLNPQQVQVPARAGVAYTLPEWGLLEWMPAHFGLQGTTVKVVGYHPTNPERRHLPTVISTIYRFDSTSGHLVGILDGTFLTALRTGASSAVASRILAKPDSRTLGIVGCGAQSVTQIHALSRVFRFERILAHDISADAAGSLRDRVAFLDVPVEVVPRTSLATLLESSDILCTCTSAAPGEGPIFPDFNNRPHLHVNGVGSDFHGKFELPVTLLRRALVCPDFLEQARQEGECQQLDVSEIGPDFTTIVKRSAEYEAAQSALTVFDSTGWAIEDHVVATMMFEFARELGVGRTIALECLPPDPKDPYSLLHADDRLAVAASVRADVV